VYFDAHLDVRETAGSGMAFRRLVEDCGVRELRVHGLNAMANAAEHMEWFKAHRGTVCPSDINPMAVDDDLTPVPGSTYGDPRSPFGKGDCFASFDLDVLDAAAAPGVSAINPAGWSVAKAETWVYACGRNPRVKCFDLMELNPAFDEGGRTARAAAHLFLHFLRGFAERRT
jgi:arginase family enzyme